MREDRPGATLLDALPVRQRETLVSLGALAADRGTRAYAVGGLVRDLVVGADTFDLDVVVEEDAIEFAAAAESVLGGSVKAHTRFGTVVLVLPGGAKVDLATSRSEVYERPGALPTVRPGDIESDLRRRDFTVNAMALAINPDEFGLLLDPYGGRADLERGVLRVLTEVSFEDDPTRILRGVRFSARFGLAIESSTEALLRKAVGERRTDTVSGERLLNEIRLILSEEDVWPPVFRLIDWGILTSMVEGWNVPLSVRSTIVELDRLLREAGATESDDGDAAAGRWTGLFAALLEPVDAPTREAIVERLSAGRRVRTLARELDGLESDVRPVLTAEEDVPNSELHSLLTGYSDETLLLARALDPEGRMASRVEHYQNELADVATSLTGADLAGMGVPEGRDVGDILRALLDARLDGLVESAEDESELARRLARSLTKGTETDSVGPGSPSADTGRDTEPVAGRPVTEADPESRDTLQATAVDQALTGESAVYEDTRDTQLVRRPVYEVRLEAFEGPLDLLLHLIREHEIDIYDIPIAKITEQYLEYISFMESLDLALAGEFLEMAATLIRIKVQMLLPRETDGDEEEEDPREQLVRKLVEYRQFKEAAQKLSSMEQERRDYFARGVDPRSYADLDEEEVDMAEFLRDVTLFDLVDGLREVLSRVPERVDVHSVDMEEVTVEEQIDRIRKIVAERTSVPFTDVFGPDASRFRIIATFIALLELIRLGEVRAVQTRNFGDIEILATSEE